MLVRAATLPRRRTCGNGERVSVADDIRVAMKRIAAEPMRPTVTIHHPKCPILKGGGCTCGGIFFPTHA